MQIIQIFAQVNKKETKCQLLIFPHLSTSQKPNGSSSNNRSSSKVLAFDVKDILKLIELGEVRDILGGVTTNSVKQLIHSPEPHISRASAFCHAHAPTFFKTSRIVQHVVPFQKSLCGHSDLHPSLA